MTGAFRQGSPYYKDFEAKPTRYFDVRIRIRISARSGGGNPRPDPDVSGSLTSSGQYLSACKGSEKSAVETRKSKSKSKSGSGCSGSGFPIAGFFSFFLFFLFFSSFFFVFLPRSHTDDSFRYPDPDPDFREVGRRKIRARFRILVVH